MNKTVVTSRSTRSPHTAYSATVQLAPHQLAMLHACKQQERKHPQLRGLLTAPPGSGKTFVALALCCRPRELSLIVVPRPIHRQWMQEAAKFNIRSRSLVDYSDVLQLQNRQADDSGVIITEPLMYPTICETCKICQLTFDRVVLDEGDSLGFFTCRCVHPSPRVWTVTADRYHIPDNNPRSVGVDVEPDFAVSAFPLPLPEVSRVLCRDDHASRILSSVLSPGEMRPVYAGDYTFIKQPDRAMAVDTAADAVKTLLAATTAEMEQINRQLEGAPDVKRTGYREHLQGLKAKAEQRLQLMRERITETGMCNICLEPLEELEVATKCCQNTLCKPCMAVLTLNDCPICRALRFEVVVVKQDAIATPPVDQLPSKLDALLTVVAEARDAHILVFSLWSGMFDKIRERLDGRGVQYVTLDGGNRAEIDKAVDKYKGKGASVFLGNASFFGRGLNLERTTDVVLLHSLSSKDWSQVVGRAQRPGRTQRLRVWELTYEGEKEAMPVGDSAGC